MRTETLTFTDHDGVTHTAFVRLPESLAFADTERNLMSVELANGEQGRGIKLSVTGDPPASFTTSETLVTGEGGTVTFNLSRILQRYLPSIMDGEMLTTYDGHGDGTQRWQRMRDNRFVTLSLYYVDVTDWTMNLTTNTRIGAFHGCNRWMDTWATQRKLHMYLYYPTEIDVYNAATAPTAVSVNGSPVLASAITQLSDANSQYPALKRLNILDYLVSSGAVASASDSFFIQTEGLMISDDVLQAAQKDVYTADLSRCAEKHGVFLRWIGTDGGIYHYLFESASEGIETRQEEFSMPYLPASSFNDGCGRPLQPWVRSFTADRVISVGAQFADREDARQIMTLATSPCIEMMVSCTYQETDIREVAGGLVTAYKGSLANLQTRWKRVTVKPGSFTFATRDTLHVMGLEIVEPNTETL